MNLPVITAAEVVCSVGLDAGAACAAIRCGLDNVVESRFHDGRSDWLPVAAVPSDPPVHGIDRWLAMLVPAVESCLHAAGRTRTGIRLLRPRGAGHDAELADELVDHLRTRVPNVVAVELTDQHGFDVLRSCHEANESLGTSAWVIAGVDSWLHAAAITPLLNNGTLIGPTGIHHATAGEAASAVLCRSDGDGLHCLGIGSGVEPSSSDANVPLKAEGLTAAGRAALQESELAMHDIAWRIGDCQMDQRSLKEAALAHRRLSRQTRESCPLWQPCRSTGLVGVATVPLLLTVAWMAFRKGYALGDHVLLHANGLSGNRSVAVCAGQARPAHEESVA